MNESAPAPILVPREIVNADSVFLVRWLLEEGATVEPGTPVCEIETSKAVMGVEAERRGFLRHAAGAGDEVPIGGVLGYVTAAAATRLPDSGLSDAAPATAVAAVQISAKARQKIDELNSVSTRRCSREWGWCASATWSRWQRRCITRPLPGTTRAARSASKPSAPSSGAWRA